MTVRVFADFHHHALWESLRLLFEGRFGWDLYRPTGMEWFDAELWNYERQQWGDAVAKQYLAHWGDDVEKADHWERWDRKYPGQTFKMVTLEQFRAQRWDFVIATLDHNEPAYAKLAAEAGARYGIEIGNQWGGHAFQLKPFVISSVTPNPAPSWCDTAICRQEFDATTMFRYEAPRPSQMPSVASFVNCFPTAPTYPKWRATAALCDEAGWKVFGPYCEGANDEFKAGDIEQVPDIADRMREAAIGWHDKHWSDGFGHVIHNWFAVGRPVFGSAAYYDGRRDGQRRIAADLFTVDNSVDITDLGAPEVARRIREILGDPDRYLRMCEASRARFDEVVDFAADADAVHVMLTGGHL